MTAIQSILLSFALLLCFTHGHGESFQCVHNVHSSEITAQVHIDPVHHVLKREMEQPLRTYVFYDATVNESIPEEKRRRIQTNIIPELTSFLQQVLMVRETAGPILLERDCTPNQFFFPRIGEVNVRKCVQQCSSTTFCGTVQIPEDHLKRCIECNGGSIFACTPGDPPTDVDGNGLSGVDFVLYVSANQQATTCVGNSGVIAFAGSCQLEATLDRPIAGFINFCPDSSAFDSETSDEFIFAVAKHELLHALAFSSSLYPFWRYPNGDPRTARNPGTGLPPTGPNGFQWGNTTIRTVTYTDWQTRSGPISHEVSLLVTERVVEEGRQHFNCPTLEGVELENQGGSGTALSHWEQRILGNEGITGVFTFNPVFSRLTFAALEDTGWYTVNYSMADTLVWGKDAGCEFAAGSCGGYIASQQQSNNSVAPFCTTQQSTTGDALDCTVDRSAVSLCNLQTVGNLPTEFQYFSNPELGGRLEVTDFCPFQNDFVFASGMGTQCSDSSNQPSNNINAETYGAGSRCVKQGRQWRKRNGFTEFSNSLYGSGCYQYECSESGVILLVLGQRYSCACEGEELVIDITVSGVRHTGSLICPSCTQICYDQLNQCPDQEPPACYGRVTTAQPVTIIPTTQPVETNVPTPTTAQPVTIIPTTQPVETNVPTSTTAQPVTIIPITQPVETNVPTSTTAQPVTIIPTTQPVETNVPTSTIAQPVTIIPTIQPVETNVPTPTTAQPVTIIPTTQPVETNVPTPTTVQPEEDMSTTMATATAIPTMPPTLTTPESGATSTSISSRSGLILGLAALVAVRIQWF